MTISYITFVSHIVSVSWFPIFLSFICPTSLERLRAGKTYIYMYYTLSKDQNFILSLDDAVCTVYANLIAVHVDVESHTVIAVIARHLCTPIAQSLRICIFIHMYTHLYALRYSSIILFLHKYTYVYIYLFINTWRKCDSLIFFIFFFFFFPFMVLHLRSMGELVAICMCTEPEIWLCGCR